MFHKEKLCKFGYAELGASTFVASAHPSESCGSNGLPLTPNSVKILGQAQHLYSLAHPHLCNYVHIQRGKHERIIVIQEYYHLNIEDAWKKYEGFRSEERLLQVFFESLQGLVYLHEAGINCCNNICPSNILLDPFGHVKLYNHGLYYMTEFGTAVSFPIGGPYSSPEVLLGCAQIADSTSPGETFNTALTVNPSADVWSLGLIVLELLLRSSLDSAGNLVDIETMMEMVVENVHDNLISALLDKKPDLSSTFQVLSQSTQDVLKQCLLLSPTQRPAPRDLLSHVAFQGMTLSVPLNGPLDSFPAPDLCFALFAKSSLSDPREKMLPQYPLPQDLDDKARFDNYELEGLRTLSFREVFELWRLAGGQAEQDLVKHGLIRTHPPILTLPSVALVEGELLGGQFHRLQRLQPSGDTLSLSLSVLLSRLSRLNPEDYYPIVTKEEYRVDVTEARNLPLVIRERDLEYQFHRILLYHRLLKAYPFTRNMIVKEAQFDIPPLWRGLAWAALLEVSGFVNEDYKAIDKVTPTSTDRQIEVDIPRCHQYDELLSSPRAHLKFTRLLKAWVVSHPGLVYWQGLDSLTAPFLYLNFNNEALAYACLSAFINKYLHKFFLRDNSSVIQEYLAKFSHLIAFHDPVLFSHLRDIGFVPELYAIPWFLTMYTHVFPLSQIVHVWDTLLLHRPCLALCVAVAILKHLRHQLLTFTFNDCILLFSDMPDINIEVIVSESVELLNQTPPSLTFRHHAPQIDSNINVGLDLEPTMMAELNDMSGVTLSEQRSEVCGRVSATDLLLLTKHLLYNCADALIIDIRAQHIVGSLVGAWNIPGEAWLQYMSSASVCYVSGGEDYQPCLKEVKEKARDKVVVVMGNRTAHQVTMQVCEHLVTAGVARVCCLHGGAEIFQHTGLFVVNGGS